MPNKLTSDALPTIDVSLFRRAGVKKRKLTEVEKKREPNIAGKNRTILVHMITFSQNIEVEQIRP
jgi:hypothetical protein